MLKNSWKSRYARWLRIGNWMLVPIYFFVVAIPLYYEWKTEVPAPEKLVVAEGHLTYQLTGKRGPLIGLKENEGTQYYSCKSGLFTNSHNCFVPRETLERVAGREATIWWFEQTVYPYTTQRRLVKLVAADEDLVTSDRTEKRAYKARQRAPWVALGLLVFFGLVAFFFERNARRIERGSTIN